MKKNVLIIFLFPFCNAFAQWTAITPPAGTLNVYSVYAITNSAVAIAGDGKISRSIDGGLNWTTRPF